MRILILNAEREDYQGTGVDLTQASYVTMTTMIQNSCSNSVPIINMMLIPILQKIEATLDSSKVSQEKAQHLQDCFCGLLQVILIKVGHQVDPQLASNIITMIIKLF